MLLVCQPHDLSEEGKTKSVVCDAVSKTYNFLHKERLVILEVLEGNGTNDGLQRISLTDGNSICCVL